jgi:alpha-1,2-mannosyltransferase
VFILHRVVLASISSACDAFLHDRIAKHLNPHIARYFLVASIFSTGMFISSTAMLPSTLAMYAVSLATGLAISPSSRENTFMLILTIGFGSLVGS